MTLQSWSHLLQGTKTSNSKCIEINWIINIRLSITIIELLFTLLKRG